MVWALLYLVCTYTVFSPRTVGCKEDRDAQSGIRSSIGEPRVTQGVSYPLAIQKEGYLVATSKSGPWLRDRS